MAQQEKLILRRNKIKYIFVILLFFFLNQYCHSQKCIDTLNIKGYYIIKRMKSDHQHSNKVINKKNVKTVYVNIDTHQDELFIPLDSINNDFNLSYRLNNFFNSERQIFMSCQRVYLKNLLSKECLSALYIDTKNCIFPELKPQFYYTTTDSLSNSFFEIYYFDAFWAKIKIKKGSFQAHLVPNRQVQKMDFTKSNYFDLFYFLKNESPILDKQINEKNIIRWFPK
jgi:hypothetical protein